MYTENKLMRIEGMGLPLARALVSMKIDSPGELATLSVERLKAVRACLAQESLTLSNEVLAAASSLAGKAVRFERALTGPLVKGEDGGERDAPDMGSPEADNT